MEGKGYKVTPVNHGAEAIRQAGLSDYDVVLLDENMPGLSGLEVLSRLKDQYPLLPVVMVTKSEEEMLMQEAIGSKIADYLIKPVHPKQLLSAIIKITDHKRLIAEKTTAAYREDFGALGMSMSDPLTAEQWAELYERLVKWDLNLEESGDAGMKEVFAMQKAEANRLFVRFIKSKYEAWYQAGATTSPILSHQLLQKNCSRCWTRTPKFCSSSLIIFDWISTRSLSPSSHPSTKTRTPQPIIPFCRPARNTQEMHCSLECRRQKLFGATRIDGGRRRRKVVITCTKPSS